MRPPIQRAVLAAHVKPDPATTRILAEAFHEALEMLVMQHPARRKVLVVIGEGDEAVLLVERSLMEAAHRPAPGPLQAAPDALIARQQQLPGDVVPPSLREDDASVGALVRLDRMEARHYRRQPPRIGAAAMFGAFVR